MRAMGDGTADDTAAARVHPLDVWLSGVERRTLDSALAVDQIIGGETSEAVREALAAYAAVPTTVTPDEAAMIMCALHAQVARSPLVDNATPTDGWCGVCQEGQHPGWQFENSGAAIAAIISAVLPAVTDAERSEWRARQTVIEALRGLGVPSIEIEPIVDTIRRIQREREQAF